MKEKLNRIAKNSISAVAVIQLAMSQIHIGIITKVFAPHVGFYLFLFIIFGLVTAFNSGSSLKGGKAVLFIAGCLMACSMGALYLAILFKDIQLGNYLTIGEARQSIIIITLSLIVYFSSGIVLLVTGQDND